MSIINEITAKRIEQDLQWGGPDHDDKHDWYDWRQFLYKQITGLSMASNPKDRRQYFINIAALAVAAIESIDRQK